MHRSQSLKIQTALKSKLYSCDLKLITGEANILIDF